MNPHNPPQSTTLQPIFVSVKEAARMLNVKPWTVYNQMLDAGLIESRYFGKRRMVVLKSLQEFADGLPTERPS